MIIKQDGDKLIKIKVKLHNVSIVKKSPIISVASKRSLMKTIFQNI